MYIESWGKSYQKNIKTLDSILTNKTKSTIPIGNQNSLSDCFIPISNYGLIVGKNNLEGYLHPKMTVSEFIFQEQKILYGTPGNSNVTIAGAIASNTYGKEAYLGGSFIKNVEELILINSEGNLIKANRLENKDLFYSTFAGFGLTGLISGIKLKNQLISYSNHFFTSVTKGRGYNSLNKTLSLKPTNFSQIILDLTKKDINFILKESISSSEHILKSKNLIYKFPNFKLPNLSFIGINMFGSLNILHSFNKLREKSKHQFLEEILFPLNHLSDPRNFTKNNEIIEIQFSLPIKFKESINDILEIFGKSIKPIACSIKFLANQIENPYLSFVQEGYAINVTFDKRNFNEKIRIKILDLLLLYECKINLSKDTILDYNYFNKMYPESIEWKKIVKKYDPNNYFQSGLSKRLNLKKT